ncbi:MAG: threonine-phosphate decarboxylase CobD [Rhizobiaceae bacterium]
MSAEGKKSWQAVEHGGSLGAARALFPDAPQPFVDLSTGINPHAYPLLDLPASALTRLPEPSRLAELMAVAARTYRAPSLRNVVAAPGTQILLPRVASLVKPGRALVLGPTYQEHARAAAIAGHDVAEVSRFEELEQADLAILVNPNNPDGRVIERADLLALLGTLAKRGGLLVVDEAFMDVGPRAESVASDVEQGGLVVLRSFGKFFGLAGVRLGFALAAAPLAKRLDRELGPWAVAGPALEYGLQALADVRWQDAMRLRLADEAARLDALFARSGQRVSGGTSLFRHFRLDCAQQLYRSLGEQGIFLRAFGDRPTELRCGLPANETEWRRLGAALQLFAETGQGR